MIKSMTGFGRSQVNARGYQVSCEVKGVNHRYFDVYLRTSRRYSLLEEKIREELKKYVARGRIEITINIEKTDDTARIIKVDKGLVMAYDKSLKELAENLNISPNFKTIDLFRLPDVFRLEELEEDMGVVWSVIQEAVTIAMQGFVEMRSREGENLADDIRQRNRLILTMVEQLEARSPIVADQYQEKIRGRLLELVSQEMVDENRLIQEAAIFADKANVTEEIVRLKSHVQQLEVFLGLGEPTGRKCDFLVQEMFREINTIASKANDLEMSHVVVDVKAELEKIREQLQNIE